MGDTYILKLGGSIITEKKSGRPIFRASRVKQIAREIARARLKKPNLRLIILHGVGSFGHPLAHRYGLLDSPLSPKTFIGVGRTTSAVRELGTRLSSLLLDAGIPVVPLQTSSFTSVKRGRLDLGDLSIVQKILDNDGVPLFGGDVVFTDTDRTAVASADVLAVVLAKKFKKARLFYATDTNGVYETFPSRSQQRHLDTLDRPALKKLLKTQHSTIGPIDVTGAMPGKLRALLDVSTITATIFNGNTPHDLENVLLGKKRGTRVRW